MSFQENHLEDVPADVQDQYGVKVLISEEKMPLGTTGLKGLYHLLMRSWCNLMGIYSCFTGLTGRKARSTSPRWRTLQGVVWLSSKRMARDCKFRGEKPLTFRGEMASTLESTLTERDLLRQWCHCMPAQAHHSYIQEEQTILHSRCSQMTGWPELDCNS